ncbi:hypothetical protein KEM48_005186 [Puccinia striiformis f. sp. tritici PST-130]|nr:hypothetical protein KEM48_005186 [Puccinia striiformis f. sp. tritici PST-130]
MAIDAGDHLRNRRFDLCLLRVTRATEPRNTITMPLSCDLRPRSTDLRDMRYFRESEIPSLRSFIKELVSAASQSTKHSKLTLPRSILLHLNSMNPQNFKLIKGSGLLLCILACVPAIVRAGPRPAPVPQGGSRCLEATAKIVGVSGITGTASFRQAAAGVVVKVTVDGLQTRENDFFIVIHLGQTSGNGDCSQTGDHFNPSIGAIFPCPNNGADQSKCQVGDLSGSLVATLSAHRTDEITMSKPIGISFLSS